MIMDLENASKSNVSRKVSIDKMRRKIGKCLRQMQKHDPDVKHSSQPTTTLFVGNSSILCGVSLDELEQIFHRYDEQCEFVVYPNKRAYSFVQFSSIQNAVNAFDSLNGQVPDLLPPNALPFFMAFVENLPSVKKDERCRAPADLKVLENFIDEAEEKQLMETLNDCVYAKTKLKSRKVVHFGYKFNYDTNEANVPAENVIPKSCDAIIDRMMREGIFTERPDQLTVNIYEPGNGIPSHVDSHSPFGDAIVSLSLLSDLVMEFRDFANTASVYNVLVPRFSLTVMRGESRYRWKHGWVGLYMQGMLLCCFEIGCDMCEKLCGIAMSKGGNVVRANALQLPYLDGCADAVLSIAVIHHLSTEKRRLVFDRLIHAIEELMRILRVEGRACVSVWAMEQTHNDVVSEYLKMRGNKSHVQMNRRDSHGRLRVHEGQDFTQQDMLVPWQNADGERFLRYYHLFVAGELEELCAKVKNCDVERSLYEQGNWFVFLKKTAD
ncbi:unnamed protein product [Anisakis simplex]|uniref:Alkylated DNA repair protein alkB homolog 8 (inferred by orthology to a human protein) n=1 Tax=Anisakis simplex TaxID=6269 RepID=A0A0M3K3K0_ANISI|nr:unnamed protein product [Anisakis simplex]